MADKITVIRQTQKWLSTVIIAYGLCPFAKREFDNETIHYAVVKAKGLEARLEQLILECTALDNQSERETSLLIFPNTLSVFDEFLDFLALGTALMKEQRYEGTYQLASFHPEYCFEGADANDPANYTNRSPYPMLHILREASVERAIQNYPSPENIPERNIQLMKRLGLEVLSDLLKVSKK